MSHHIKDVSNNAPVGCGVYMMLSWYQGYKTATTAKNVHPKSESVPTDSHVSMSNFKIEASKLKKELDRRRFQFLNYSY